MSTLVKKVKSSLQREGVLKTTLRIAFKVIKYPVNSLRKKNFIKNVLSLKSSEDRFTSIYKNNYWSEKNVSGRGSWSEETVSGNGSTLKYTENLRKELPNIFSHYKVENIFDAPCGDFNWMQHLLLAINVQYIGGDIVRPLIDGLNKKYSNPKISFIHIDLINDVLPKSDLMICRDCLFHLSFDDTKSVLKNFVNSGTSYLLTTTHKKTDYFLNKDIHTGDFRMIDLFSAPYNFPCTPLAAIDDWIAPDPERQMCLFSREQVSDALRRFN